MPRKPSYTDLLKRIKELEAREEAWRDHAGSRDDRVIEKVESRFRDLVENSPTGISILRDDIVIYRNPEQQRIFGSLKEGEPYSIYERIHPEDREKLREMIGSTRSGQAMRSGIDLRFINLMGETTGELSMKWLHCRSSLMEHQGEKLVLVNMMDVTRAREVARILAIQDRMSSLGHVATGIAHEIRNPLSVINIYTDSAEQMLEHGFDKEGLKDVLERIQSASSKIESVIRRVMDFSKPSNPIKVRLDINKPIEDALSLSSVTLRKAGITLEKDLARDLPPCLGDYQLIEQVILNLVTNAAEAMKGMQNGKKIRVCSQSKGGGAILVSVADSGPGVPLDLARKIFDPFFTTKVNSTGIGLSLCRRIVKDHGGTMSLSAGTLGGAEFSFAIPASTRREESR